MPAPATPTPADPFRYRLETLLISAVYRALRLLPIAAASAVGSAVAGTAGPLLRRRDRVARENLAKAMPHLDVRERQEVIRGMWNNLGRTFAEFPHIGRLDAAALAAVARIEGLEHLEAASRAGRGVLCFTGHLGGWEYAPRLFSDSGYPLYIVGRSANNPGLDRLIRENRAGYIAEFIPKGRAGARATMEILKAGRCVGILQDQKMNDGIRADFFGREAMTASGIARLALRHDCPILPVRVVREGGARNVVTVYPPVPVRRTGDNRRDALEIVNAINAILEGWIREHPEQWIWLHNRWPRHAGS